MSMPDLDKAAGVIEKLKGYDWTGVESTLIRVTRDEAALVVGALRLLSPSANLLPEGFVAVPREPTEAMIEAGNNALVSWVAPAMHSAHAYRAMIQTQETQG